MTARASGQNMPAMLDVLHAAFHQPGTRAYRWVQGSVWALIVLSILVLVLEATLSSTSRLATGIASADRFLLAIFALEFVLRVGTFRPPVLRVFQRPPMGRLRAHILARLRFMARPMILIDLLAVLALVPELRGLRALRLLRLLRTTRVFRYHNPFSIIMRAFEENGLLFAFAFTVLGVATLLGGVSFYLIEFKLNPQVNSLLDGVWWALVTITTVGFGDVTPVTMLGRVVAGALMVAGMFTLALFAGIVGSSLVSGMLSIREEQFRMSDYVNHIVVCGHDESTHLLIDALTNELDLKTTRVVVFDDQERPRDLPPEFLWVQGDPTKESELDKVRLTHAAAAIITGSRNISPQNADARTILTAFTIRSFLKKRVGRMPRRRRPLYVATEILDAENVDHAQAAGADEVVETRKLGFSMIAHAVGHHGTATTMSRFVMSGQHNVYIGQIDPPLQASESYGELLVQLQLSKQGGLILGIRTPSGGEVINPPKDLLIEPGTLLIYLAKQPLLETPEELIAGGVAL